MSAVVEPSPAMVTRTQAGIMTYLSPKDALNTSQRVAALSESIQESLTEGDLRLVVDLSQVSMINSEGLSLLIDQQEKLLRSGGWLKTANPSNLIREVFAITSFCDHVPILGEESQTSDNDPLLDTSRRRLGDVLLTRGVISQPQIAEALEIQSSQGRRLGEIIVEKGWVSALQLQQALAEQLGLPFVRVRPGLFDPSTANILDATVARRLKVIPLFKIKDVVYLAMATPHALHVQNEVAERTHCAIKPVVGLDEEIVKAINENVSGSDMTGEFLTDVDDDFEVMESQLPDDYAAIDEMAAESPVINLVNSIIQRAVRDGVSDIHIEPFRTHSRIRFRIDGLLYEYKSPRIDIHPSIVSRLKVMANLDISERRLPQDGRIQVHTQGRSVDLRFSSLPGLFGEKVVLRVLDKNQAILELNKLGMHEQNLATVKRLLGRTYGLILVTGPTGSGKTTSLYAALNHLKSIEKNIVTIEDPVEYQLDIINQNEINLNIGLSFAKILKHVLRQDPDIVMVGEIRERETAEIAIQAALTGHLVLSTLHTNDSVGAITRLIDMGVEPYLLSSALVGVVAQRLIRTICPSCKTQTVAPPELCQRYGWEDQGKILLHKGRGCHECYDSGYRGRIGIHETLETNTELQSLILSNPGRDSLTAYLKENQITGLFEDGLKRVLDGHTTIEEVSRVTSL